MESYRQGNVNFEEIMNYLGKIYTLQYKYFTVQILYSTNLLHYKLISVIAT